MTKNKWSAALFNLVLPGLGTFYARKVLKSILIYLFFLVAILSVRFIAYSFTLFVISIVLIMGYYLIAVISGYRDVEEDKVYEPSTFDHWYVYVLIISFNWILASLIAARVLDAITPINFAKAGTPSMDPGLQVGDIFAFQKGSGSIERNNVLVFWSPFDNHSRYTSRCIGLPGDSLQIKNSVVWINGSPLKQGPLRFRYTVTTDGSPIHRKILEKNNLKEEDYMVMSSDTYEFFLLDEQAQAFKDLKIFKSVERRVVEEGLHDPQIYPEPGNFDWNVDFYGPLYIPKKGDEIELTSDNIDLYLKCMESENEKVVRGETGIEINGELKTTYQFKENYFFVMGDNRHNSLDSRYWGLLPESMVLGKVMYIYWGSANDRIGKEL